LLYESEILGFVLVFFPPTADNWIRKCANMRSPDRTVFLTIDGDLAAGGRVPIDILAAKMKGLHELVAATAKLTAPVLPRGKKGVAQIKVAPKDAGRLFFKDFKRNCLTVEFDLAEGDALFAEEDWPVSAADMAGELLRGIRDRNESRLAQLVPDASARMAVARKARALMPASLDHQVKIRTPHQSVDLASPVDDYIKTLEAQFAAEQREQRRTDCRTAAGKVTLIDIGADPPMVGIRHGLFTLFCALSPNVSREIVGDLTPGALVEITGEAVLDAKGKLRQIVNVSELRQLRQEPIRWTRLTCGNREFIFSRDLVVKVTNSDGGWVFETEEPSIVGFGLQRQEAHLAFRQDFATCWDVIASKEDDRLTLDAIDLKTALKSLVADSRIIE